MPVKNVRNPGNSNYEGEITGLNENEKKVLNEFLTEGGEEQKIPTKVSELENDAGYITKEVNDLVNYPTKEEIDSKITAVYRPKGSCAYADLPASPEVGDVYNVTDAHEGHPAGTNYVWTGSTWDALSGVVDLTPYLTKEEATSTYATKQSVSEVEAKIPSIEGLATTAEVNEATKDVVKYQSFQNPGDTAERKTIQLANHDNISGIGTNGQGYNIAMVSKWDKVDLGAAGLSINLNGKDARPTYNDDKEIALVEDLPDVSNLATKEEVEEVKSSIPSVEELATKDELSEAVKDTVKYQSFQNPNDDAPRKTIQLANHDTISGVSTTGSAHNLIMLSKWDKVDIGAAGVTINLNGKDPRPTYNDDKELALKEDIPDTSSFATKEEIEGLVNEDTLASTIGEERKAITKEIETATSNLVTNETFTTTLGDYALKSELPNTEEFVKESELPNFGTFALKTELPDTSEFALKSEIPEVDGFATKTEVSALIKTVGEGLQVGDSEHTTNINTTADNKVMINSVGEVVYSTPYPGEETRKVVQFKNNDQLSGVTTTGTGVPLIFVSKWDKVEVGGNAAPLNLNGSAERPTYKDDEELAFVSDLEWIPVVCNMPFRTLGDKVYSQEEIFKWFWVEDLPGLKNTIIKHPIYLRYGISLSTNPMYYYIPCQYVAFTDANTVEMITDGLDTKNDKFSRYHITIKLDGTVINGKSNIKVECEAAEDKFALKTEIPSVENLATKEEVNACVKTEDLSTAVEGIVADKNYLTTESFTETMKTYYTANTCDEKFMLKESLNEALKDYLTIASATTDYASKEELSAKQNKVDDLIYHSSHDVVQALNDLNDRLTALEQRIAALE